MVEYIVIILLSLLSCVLGFKLEVLKGNLYKIKNGSIPDTGVAILPDIPLVPLFWAGVAWAINQTQLNGFAAVTIVLFLLIAIKQYGIYSSTKKMANLSNEKTNS